MPGRLSLEIKLQCHVISIELNADYPQHKMKDLEIPDRGLRVWLAYSNLFADIGEEVERAAGGGVPQQTVKFESAVIGFLLM